MSRIFTAAVALAVLLLAVPASAGTPGWIEAPAVPVPKGAIEEVLRAVTVVSPNDVWAVGGWTGDTGHPLAVHWDGTAWQVASTPDAWDGISEYGLNSVDAVATNDIWAVGDVEPLDGSAKVTPLLLHYDGVSWTEEPGPLGVTGELRDVDLLTADEGWAVGASGAEPLILHRKSGVWDQMFAPPVGAPASLAAVFATSQSDAWAVGTQLRDGRSAALVLHWDGSQWSSLAVPYAGPSNQTLSDVAAASDSDVWMVGSLCAPLCRPQVLHLTAGTWRSEVTAADATLTSVIAFAPTDVWIFGQSQTSGTALDHIEHWDGSGFTTDQSVPPTSFHHSASALSLASAGADRRTQTLWAVGWIQDAQKTAHAIYRP